MSVIQTKPTLACLGSFSSWVMKVKNAECSFVILPAKPRPCTSLFWKLFALLPSSFIPPSNHLCECGAITQAQSYCEETASSRNFLTYLNTKKKILSPTPPPPSFPVPPSWCLENRPRKDSGCSEDKCDMGMGNVYLGNVCFLVMLSSIV